MRIRLEVAYLGGRYHGWQRQPGLATIQGVLDEAVSRIGKRPVLVMGASRTDAGVHARGQVVAFDYEGRLTPGEFLRALNHWTPADIRVVRVDVVPSDFHPRHDARGKVYRYRMRSGFVADPFDAGQVYHVKHALDVEAMDRAARLLEGEHDFSSFRGPECDADHAVRRLFSVRVRRTPDGLVCVEVAGTAFLKYMVRNMVGTLLQVGGGRRTPASMRDVLAAHDRQAAGPTAEPHALTLERVFYPSHPWAATARDRTDWHPGGAIR